MMTRQTQHWGRLVGALALTFALAVRWGIPVAGATLVVRADDDLQAAIDRARPGDTLLLEPGATYTGNFVLPDKGGTRPIVIRSGADDRRLPGLAERVGPDDAPLLPKLKSPNSQPVLRTAPGASLWRLFALEFVGNGQAGDMITLGDGSSAQKDVESLPSELVLDRILVRGDAGKGQKRGIALNSGSTTIRNSYISDIKAFGQESQAIAGWNGTGPYTIENNYLEAAGVNILFGGADPAIQDLVPSDIIIRRNHITKNVAWRGSTWTVKNLLELKNARRVVIEGNRLENCWNAAQPGHAILFTVRNSGGRAPWVTIEDVVFRSNVVRHSAGGINILGADTGNVSRTASGISIVNNLFEDINHRNWGGNGLFLQIGNAPANVTVDHNTVFQTGNIITAYGRSRGAFITIPGFRFTNNVTMHNAYGIFGSGSGVGSAALSSYFQTP